MSEIVKKEALDLVKRVRRQIRKTDHRHERALEGVYPPCCLRSLNQEREYWQMIYQRIRDASYYVTFSMLGYDKALADLIHFFDRCADEIMLGREYYLSALDRVYSTDSSFTDEEKREWSLEATKGQDMLVGHNLALIEEAIDIYVGLSAFSRQYERAVIGGARQDYLDPPKEEKTESIRALYEHVENHQDREKSTEKAQAEDPSAKKEETDKRQYQHQQSESANRSESSNKGQSQSGYRYYGTENESRARTTFEESQMSIEGTVDLGHAFDLFRRNFNMSLRILLQREIDGLGEKRAYALTLNLFRITCSGQLPYEKANPSKTFDVFIDEFSNLDHVLTTADEQQIRMRDLRVGNYRDLLVAIEPLLRVMLAPQSELAKECITDSPKTCRNVRRRFSSSRDCHQFLERLFYRIYVR